MGGKVGDALNPKKQLDKAISKTKSANDQLFGGKKGGGEALDPIEIANVQKDVNRDALLLNSAVNRVDTQGPFGSIRFKQGPNDVNGNPTFLRTTALPFAQQFQLNRLNTNALGVVQDAERALDNPVDLNQGPDINRDYSEDARRVEQATFDRIRNLARPEEDLARRRLESRLSSRGIPIGGEADNDVTSRFDRGINEARLAAALEAVGAGRAEQSRRFATDLETRRQVNDETIQQRERPLRELAQLMALTANIPRPQSEGTPTFGAAPTDVAGLFQQQNAQQRQDQQAQKAGQTQLLGTLAAAAATAFSDARLKNNLEPLGTFNGFDLYGWEWNEKANELGLSGHSFGVIAQEVQKIKPDAVSEHESGYLKVDYSKLGLFL